MNPIQWIRDKIKVHQPDIFIDPVAIMAKIMGKVNEFRKNQSLSVLAIDRKAETAAIAWAASIAKSGKPDHVGIADRIVMTVPVEILSMENLAAAVIEEWAADPKIAVILQGRYRGMAMGIATGPDDLAYFVLDFS